VDFYFKFIHKKPPGYPDYYGLGNNKV